MLGERLIEPMRIHLGRVRVLHERDLAEGFGEVHMPFAQGIDRKAGLASSAQA